MDEITKKEFEETEIPPIENSSELTEEQFKKMLAKMQHPIEVQKEIAVKVKQYLDKRMADELEEEGVLSKMTLEWVSQFNRICDSIQRGIYGNKNINLNIHKISHSDISAKIREAEESYIILGKDESRRNKRKTTKSD